MKTILVVDNDRNVLALAGIILGKLGHTVLKARGADEGMALFPGNRKLDLLVTDVRLGPVDGFQLAAYLRIERPLLPVLHMSMNISDASRMPADSRLSADEFFLLKPFLPKDLSDMATLLLRPSKGELVLKQPGR